MTGYAFAKRDDRLLQAACVLCLLNSCGPLMADDWPQWLGPGRDGVWREDGILQEFPAGGPRLRWQAKIGGGYSGPAVADGRVFVMDRTSAAKDLHSGRLLHAGPAPRNQNFVRRLLPGSERVVCLNEADGRVLWTHVYDCPYTMVATYAIGPRVTPTVDGDRVYTLGAEGHLLCLNVDDGRVRWSRDLRKDYGVKTPLWGFSSHPLVDGPALICMVGGRQATVVAFDKHTGREIWKALDADEPGYAPPMICTFGGQRQLVIWDSAALSGLDPRTGNRLWSVQLKPTFAMAIGTPRQQGNRLFVMSYNRQSACVQVNATGRSAQVQWRGNARRGIDGVMNSPFIVDDHIYGCGQGGRYICAKLDSGERVWDTFRPSTGERPAAWANVFTIRHADKYFLANDLGDLILARMSPQGYQEISRAHLIDPTHTIGRRTVVWSHPAFARRSVYLRNDAEIRCYSLAASNR